MYFFLNTNWYTVRDILKDAALLFHTLSSFSPSLFFALFPLKSAILLSTSSFVHMQTMLLCCQSLQNSEMTKPTCLRGAPISNPFGVRRAKGTRSETRQSSLQKICKPANVGSSSETNSKEMYMRQESPY